MKHGGRSEEATPVAHMHTHNKGLEEMSMGSFCTGKRPLDMGMGTLCTAKSRLFYQHGTFCISKKPPIYGQGDTLHKQKGPHIWAWGHFALAKMSLYISIETFCTTKKATIPCKSNYFAKIFNFRKATKSIEQLICTRHGVCKAVHGAITGF